MARKGGEMKKDKYKHFNVDVCLICELAIPTKYGTGIRPMICGECGEKARKKYRDWNAAGMYLARKKEGE